MTVRNCALTVGACIILAMAATRSYGGNLAPRQVLLVTDASASLCKALVDENINRRNPNLTDAELKTDGQLEEDVRARFGELFLNMARKEPGWLAFVLSGDEFEGLIRETLLLGLTFNRSTCQNRLNQFIVKTIYQSSRRAAAPPG
jgi:hypothetical protein